MTVTPITSLAQFKDIINKDKVAIIDLGADWCGPCRMMGPVFEKLSGEFPSVDFYKVDTDQHPDIANELAVRSLPTFIAFKKGEQIQKVVGASSPDLTNLITAASKH